MMEEKKTYLFLALIYPCGADFEVYVPALDAYTQGSDLDDAAYMAQDLVETMVSLMVEHGEEVPKADLRQEAPEGGYAMIVATHGDVPEVAEMSVSDAADILGVTESYVYTLCARGKLEHRKVGRTTLVSTASVKERANAGVRPGRPRKLATA